MSQNTTPPPEAERGTGAPAPGDDDLGDVRAIDGIVLVVFWVLAFVVFLQFFTRYVLNDSLGWTEEIARFLLIAVTFLGAFMAVRKESHIAVELVFRYLPRRARFVLQIVIDAIALIFYATTTWLCTQMAQRTHQMMVSIDVPKSVVYWFVAACFLVMTVYGVSVLRRHWRSGTSRLVDPDDFAVVEPNV